MKKIFKLLSLFLIAISVVNCEEYDAGTENANPILNYGYKFKSDNFDVPSTNPEYKLVVFATQTSESNRTLQVILNETESVYDPGDVISYPTSIVIPAGSNSGEGTIVFDYDNLSFAIDANNPPRLVFDLVWPSDGVRNITAETTTIFYVKECLDNKVNLSLVFDDYPEESYWDLYLDGNLYASTAAGDYDGLETATQDFCLPAGNYTFTMRDVYGDGMFDGTNTGSYTIKLGSTVLGSGSGNFGAAQSVSFTLQ
ncbi:hypothetical protein [Flavobacterium sp. J27]|uniref:hypothetical protein n=1 Tax=Flavobacterium sp. J27 TaxID=2060419 RepID=UPI0010320361|nr:hypothetical protein [Flavobacterium sp. J27]